MPCTFDVLKTNICPRREVSSTNMLVLITSNVKGACNSATRPIVPRHNQKMHCLYCLTCNFIPCGSSKIILNYFHIFQIKVVKANHNIWKENGEIASFFFLFLIIPLVYIKIFTDHYYLFWNFPRMGIISRKMNIIASRDQFKLIKFKKIFWWGDGLWKGFQSRLPFKVFSESGYNCSPWATTC